MKKLATVVLILFGVSAGFAVATTSAAFAFLEEESTKTETSKSLEQIEFSAKQARELDTVYYRRDIEWAWCFDLNGSRVNRLMNPEYINTSRTHVEFRCTSNAADGSIHTHPKSWSNGQLSEADKRSELAYSCLVHDRVPARFFENPRGLDCYYHLGEGRVEEVDVVVSPR